VVTLAVVPLDQINVDLIFGVVNHLGFDSNFLKAVGMIA